MTLYSIILFLHVAAVLGLFASLSFEVLSLFHLRRASDFRFPYWFPAEIWKAWPQA